jgi:hypothetical protein
VCVHLAKFIPLPCPCPLPPGIIGNMTIRVAGLLREICEHFLGMNDPAWLNAPLIQEWLMAVVATPQAFITKWLTRAWISDSIT